MNVVYKLAQTSAGKGIVQMLAFSMYTTDKILQPPLSTFLPKQTDYCLAFIP